HPRGEVTPWHGPVPAASTVRRIDFVSKGRTIGQVVVFLPLDHQLVQWLTRRAGLGSQQQIGFGSGGNLVGADRTLRIESGSLLGSPGDIQAGGVGYRTVDEDLGSNAKGTRLAVLEPSSHIDSKASLARWRVVGLGFTVIIALLAMAYAVSPSIARSRVSKQERERAERVLAHVGDGVFLVDDDGVVRLWNQAAEAITGLRADEVCAGTAADAVPGWSAIAGRVPVARRPGEIDDESSAETVPLEINGREIWLSIAGVTLPDGIVYAFRDVTRERRL